MNISQTGANFPLIPKNDMQKNQQDVLTTICGHFESNPKRKGSKVENSRKCCVDEVLSISGSCNVDKWNIPKDERAFNNLTSLAISKFVY